MLHQAAVLALHSITAVVRRQQHMDSILVYLDKHGEQIFSIDIKGAADLTPAATLRELPPTLQLSSLHFECLCLQVR
jgi:hypothetical protein